MPDRHGQGQPLASKIFSFRAAPRVLAVLARAIRCPGGGQQSFRRLWPAGVSGNAGLLAGAGDRHLWRRARLAEAHRPLWIARGGLRIAVLAYNEFKPRSFEAGAEWPGIAWSEDSQVVADIRAARAAGADLVIPFMHWGWEREAAAERAPARSWPA
jgi:hypothetical protein